MSLALLAVSFIVLLVVAYRLYGAWVARQFVLGRAIGQQHQPAAGLAQAGVDTRHFELAVGAHDLEALGQASHGSLLLNSGAAPPRRRR